MAANMQNMANAGHLMAQQQQQQRSKVSAQIASHVYQYLAQNTPQYNGMAWQANMTISDRMGKIVEMYVATDSSENAGGGIANNL